MVTMMNIRLKTIIMLVVLTQLIACSDSSIVRGVNKYSISTNWQSLPANASQLVDVFFLYPSTYFPDPTSNGPVYSPSWNQTIGQAQADPGISNQVASKASVFHRAGTNLYVPYFQQAAGINVLEALLWKTNEANSAAASLAMEIAYRDVEDAFDYFLSHYNKDANNKIGRAHV